MRIGTWNVEYARGSRNPDRRALLMEHKADIWILTETHTDLDLSQTHSEVVCSEKRPGLNNRKVNDGSTWVTIWSKYRKLADIKVRDPRRMVVAAFESPMGPLVVAGVVLPWHSDRGDVPPEPAPRNWAEYLRVLRSDLPSLLKTMRDVPECKGLVIAGDFNSVLADPYPFPYPYPPEDLRLELLKMLRGEGFSIHTANTLYPKPSTPRMLIDHVCTNMGNAEKVETWTGIDGKSPRLSDHPGVVVTLPV